MSGIQVDLDNISDNPEELAKAFEQIESGDPAGDESAAPDTGGAAETKTDGKEPEKVDQQAANAAREDQGESNAAGVATRDGKHVIPYSVLKSERERASRAEQMLNEMKERVASLEGLVRSGSETAKDDGAPASTSDAPPAGDFSDADLETLKDDFPTVYRAVRAAMARATQLEAALKPIKDNAEATEAERARSTAESVQEAIDSVPKLAHIQANNAEAFELAKQFDRTLREQAAWRDRPMSERFQKVTEMVEAALGAIDVPGAAQGSQTNTGDLSAKAKAKAAAAAKGSRSDVPNSLSEFPAGQHAAQDEREEAQNLTPVQLADKFSRMSSDQLDEYFNKL
jgi:DNA-binding ferritin-like protein